MLQHNLKTFEKVYSFPPTLCFKEYYFFFAAVATDQIQIFKTFTAYQMCEE